MQGQGETGLAQLRQGMTTVLTTGRALSQPFCLVLMADAARYVGQIDEGLRLLAQPWQPWKPADGVTDWQRSIASGANAFGAKQK